MTLTEASDARTSAPPQPDPFDAMAGYIARAGTGERAALARLQADALQSRELAALARALCAARLDPQDWSPSVWSRWAIVAQGMALAGHDRRQRLGRQLAEAKIAESRVTRLLTARGDAFRQQLPRVLRLLASRSVAPNWQELGELVLREGSAVRADLNRLEQVRLRVAGAFFSELARNAST